MADQSKKDDVVVKKVNAYPIAFRLKTAERTVAGQIVKLTLQGFLAEIEAKDLKPGEHFDVSFEIPVFHSFVSERGIMVKLYNRWAGDPVRAASAVEQSAQSTGPHVIRLIEVHFESLSPKSHESISTFLRALNKNSA